MKNSYWFLFFFCLLGIGSAGEPERISPMIGKIILDSNKGYFVLSDGSFWKAVTFIKRWRTPGEWWQGVELYVPENYDCTPKDWFLGTEIEAYTKISHLNVDESFASNFEDLKKCTHLLYNRGSGKMLFAISMHPADCLGEIFAEGRQQGYDDGYLKGYNSGYDLGYKDGFNKGHLQGFNAGRLQPAANP